MKTRKKKELIVTDLFEKMIRNSKSGRRIQPNGSRIGRGTIRNYEYSLKLIKEYEVNRNTTLRIVVAPSTRELKSEKLYWRKFYKDFTDYLYREKGHFDNYVGQTIKNLRLLFNYIEK